MARKIILFTAIVAAVFFLLPTNSFAATKYWIGGAGGSFNADTNWSTASGGANNTTHPVTGDVATFSSGANTNCLIDSTVNAPSISILSGYTQTISQSAGVAVTLDSFTQADGTYSATENLTITNNFTKTAGTFNAGVGTVTFGAASNGDSTINVPGGVSFYSLVINKQAYYGEHYFTITSGQTIVVAGDLTLTQGYLQTGTVDARGKITQSNSFWGGTGTIDFGNDIVAQTYTINGGTAPTIRFNSLADMSDSVFFGLDGTITNLIFTYATPGVEIPVNLNGKTVTIYNLTMVDGVFTPPADKTLTIGNFTLSGGVFNAPANMIMCGNYTGGGTFNEGTGTVTFKTNSFSDTTINTNETFYNVVVDKENYFGGRSVTIASGKTMTVSGNLTLTTGAMRTGTAEAKGNVAVGSNFLGGDAVLLFSGSNTQTFNLTGATGLYDGGILVNKSGGQVNLLSALVMDAANQNLTITAGTFDLNGNNLTVNGTSDAITVAAGGNLQLQGGEIITANASNPQFAIGSTATYDGISGPYTIKDYAYSNLTIDGAGAIFNLPSAKILRDLTITNGTLDATASNYNITLSGNLTVSGTLNNRSNTVIFSGINQAINGNVTFNNFTKIKSSVTSLLANASLWLDASDSSYLNLNGSLVTQWSDKTGNNRNATPGGAGSAPSLHTNGLNGKNTITFGASNGMGINYNLSTAPYTLYIVYNTTGTSTPRRAIQGYVNNWLIGPYTGSHRLYAGGFDTGPAVAQGTFAISGTTNSGAAAYFYVNGTSYTSSTGYTGVPGIMCLGGYAGNNVCGAYSEPLVGDIAEVIVYPSVLSSSDRSDLECYLSQKWNISVDHSCITNWTPVDNTLTFQAGFTTTVNGTLTITGVDANNRVNLVSSSMGTAWNLVDNGTNSISWINVQDSHATGTATPVTYTNALNSGGNTGWGFDEIAPTLSNVTSTKANGTYGPGTVIDINLTFSENITTTGTVTVNLDSGGSCTFSGVTNSQIATCNYTVASGQNSSDLTVTTISGTIKDQSGNTMSDFTPLTNLAANKNIVIDTIAPLIINVTSNKANGTYGIGEVIDINVSFSKAVTSTGNVTVTLETGTIDQTCAFQITNSTTGSCNYTVQAGDTSSDLNVNSIAGTIKDQYGNAMTNFTIATNLATNKNIAIDTTAPTITNATSSKANGTYGVGITIPINITFSENVTSTGLVTVTLETGTIDRTCTFSVSNSSVGSCNYTVQAGDTSSDLNVNSISGTISDQYGNAMTNFVPATNLATNKNIVIDTNQPTILNVTSNKANGRYKAGDIIDIQVTFSEAVTSTGNVTVTLETGTIDQTCAFQITNSTTGSCNYTVQAGDTSSDLNVNSIAGIITNGNGNAVANFTPVTNLATNKDIIIDTTAPTITSVTSFKPNGTYGTGSVIDVIVNFSEAITSTGNVTVTLETGTIDRTCTFSVNNNSAGSCNYTVQAGDASSDLNVNSISGIIADQAGNTLTNYTPTTNLADNKDIVVDGQSATITNVTSNKANGRYKAGDIIDIQVTFSKAVTSTGNVTVTLETGTIDQTCAFQITNSTTGSCNYTVQAGDTSSDLNVNSIAGTIVDQLGNPMSVFTIGTNLAINKEIIIDTTAPILNSHYPTDNETSIGLNANLTLAFSETVNVGSGNIYIKKISDNSTVETISASSAQVTGGGTTNITINPSITFAELTEYYINIDNTAFVDLAGNPYAGIADNSTWNFTSGDVTSPLISSVITSKSSGTYGAGVLIDITVNFSEKVTSTGLVTVTLNTTPQRTCTFTVTDSLSGSCNYVIQNGDSVNPLNVSSIAGTIADQSSNPLQSYSIPTNLSPTKSIVIQTALPLATDPVNFHVASFTQTSVTLLTNRFVNDTQGSSGYYFYRQDNSSHNSGWIQTNTWTDTDQNFVCNQYYTYTVKQRNGDNVETASSSVSLLICNRENQGDPVNRPTPSGQQNNQTTDNVQIENLQKTIETLKAQIQDVLNKRRPQTVLVPQNPTLEQSITQTLKYGSSGKEVAQLQKKLQKLGFLPASVKANGYFGKATQKAVQDFQIKYNIVSPQYYGYGILGPATRARLNGVR